MSKFSPEFSAALDKFVAGAQDKINVYFAERLKNLEPARLSLSPGGFRYVRVVRKDANGSNGSVFCFIEVATGDVLKAEGWKGPAKHARGNIYAADNGLDRVGPYGPEYL